AEQIASILELIRYHVKKEQYHLVLVEVLGYIKSLQLAGIGTEGAITIFKAELIGVGPSLFEGGRAQGIVALFKALRERKLSEPEAVTGILFSLGRGSASMLSLIDYLQSKNVRWDRIVSFFENSVTDSASYGGIQETLEGLQRNNMPLSEAMKLIEEKPKTARHFTR
ncbi:MAG: hypothetical protein HYY44_05210, partial [Deltaproteobacteria bacterium]|nr:hypothetical protein [Deltaproteobacteria bacterium]